MQRFVAFQRSRWRAVCHKCIVSIASGVVELHPGKEALFLAGHPHIFDGAVARVIEHQQKPLQPGDIVDVVENGGHLVGWGVYNPHSLYRVRLLTSRDEDDRALLLDRSLEGVLRKRLKVASLVREASGLPSSSTTAYRLANGEGDRLTGLTVDIFNGVAVALSSAFWLERNRGVVLSALTSVPGIQEVVWRRSQVRLKQDGWRSSRSDDKVTSQHVSLVPGVECRREIVVLEAGIKFLVDTSRGSKSGFYCDQRDNRRFLAEFCRERRVLDLCCFTGGFSISAVCGGASHVIGVDSSSEALALARRNAELNGVSDRCTFVEADVSALLGSFGGEDFDVVVLDPPKLAPTNKHTRKAAARYRSLNAGAMRVLRRGGILMSCTCSGAMTQSGGFLAILKEAAQELGRSLRLLRVTGAACDHVVHPAYPEGAYLTCVTAVVL